jgi:hypothetical protein
MGGKLSSLGLLRGPPGPAGPTGPTGPAGEGGSGGGGGFSSLFLGPGDDGSQTFNGDGSGGATQLPGPMTILFSGQDGNAIYDFGAEGVSPGWIVLFAIEGSDTGTYEIRDQGYSLGFFSKRSDSSYMRGIYYSGDGWYFLDQGMGRGTPLLEFSAVDVLRRGNAASDESGSKTWGVAFSIREDAVAIKVWGVRFYWAGSGNEVIRCKLWSAAGTLLKTSTDITTAGPGVYTANWASGSYVIDNAGGRNMQTKFVVSAWEITDSKYTKVDASSAIYTDSTPAVPFLGGTRMVWIAFKLWGVGDSFPASVSADEAYLIEPMLRDY